MSRYCVDDHFNVYTLNNKLEALGMSTSEISQVFETIVAALQKKAHRRQGFFRPAAPDLDFSLETERELGTAAVIAQYLTAEDFFTRLDYYWQTPRLERPDLTVWLPKSRRLLYLELKRVGQGWSYKRLDDDLRKLERITT